MPALRSYSVALVNGDISASDPEDACEAFFDWFDSVGHRWVVVRDNRTQATVEVDHEREIGD